jgi:hypothetical protein
MARAWGKALRRCHERMDPNENTVILIDQLRTSFGMRGGKTSEEPPGGKFLGYLSSMSLNFRKGKWLMYDKNGYLVDPEKGEAKKTLGGGQEPDGREIIVRCEKSRVGRPDLTAYLHFDHGQYDFDHEWEFVKAVKYLNMVDRSGSWYTYENGNGPARVQGDKGLRELIEEHDLYDEIREKVLEMHFQSSQ